MANDWRIVLQGEPSELKELQKLSNEEWNVSRDDGSSSYFLGSRQFDGLDDPWDVRDRADELIGRISGAMALFLGSGGISVGSIQRLQPDRPPSQFILPEPIVVGRSHIELISEMTKALAMAADETVVSKALQHLDPVHSEWEALYRVFEEIQTDVGADITKWVSKAKKNNFTRTANHYRHAGNKRAPLPKNKPMDLFAAKTLIRDLVNRWVEEKSTKTKGESGSDAAGWTGD